MPMTDPIADMLTRIRNACRAKHRKVDVPASGLKREIARILTEQGFINGFTEIEKEGHLYLRLYLKYGSEEKSVITELKRVSKPGLRKYVKRHEIPRVLNGLGIAILSTSRGILTDGQARRLGVGGEVLCYVW